MECKEAEDLLPAYALNALTSEEVSQVEAHLATCLRCSALLQEHLQVVADLALAVEPVQPSPRLKARLMKQVDRTARRPESPRRLVPSLPTVALAGASLAVLLVAGVLAFTLRTSGQVDQLHDDNEALSRQVNLLQDNSSALGEQVTLLRNDSQFLSERLNLVGQDTSKMSMYVSQLADDDSKFLNALRMQRSMTYMLASPETQVLYLGNHDGSSSGEGMLMMNSGMGAGILVAAGLKALAPDQAYQVWLRKGTEIVNSGRLQVDEFGWGLLWLRPKESVAAYQWIGVTVEPTESGPIPSGTVVLSSSMTH